MGFFDSLGRGVGSIFEGLGTGIGIVAQSLGQSFVQDPFGTVTGIKGVIDAFSGSRGQTAGSPGGTVFIQQPQFQFPQQQRPTTSILRGTTFNPQQTQLNLPGQFQQGGFPVPSGAVRDRFGRNVFPQPAVVPGVPLPISGGPTGLLDPASFDTRERASFDPGPVQPINFGRGAAVPSFPVTTGTGFSPISMLPQIGQQGVAGQIFDFFAGNGGCPVPSAPFGPSCNGTSARAQTFMAANPVTGKATWFRPAGVPLLWSGDVSAAKRVARVARKARRARPR